MTKKVKLRCVIKKITVRTVLEKLKLEEKETFQATYDFLRLCRTKNGKERAFHHLMIRNSTISLRESHVWSKKLGTGRILASK